MRKQTKLVAVLSTAALDKIQYRKYNQLVMQ